MVMWQERPAAGRAFSRVGNDVTQDGTLFSVFLPARRKRS